MTYKTTYGNLWACSLTADQHERTCGYWFTVLSGACAHTAFATRAGLDRWLAERGLSLESELPEAGTSGTSRITGTYVTESHGVFITDDWRDGMGPGEFYSLTPVEATAVLSNGAYTLGLITQDSAGVRTVHSLNPNVRDRVVFDYAATRRYIG